MINFVINNVFNKAFNNVFNKIFNKGFSNVTATVGNTKAIVSLLLLSTLIGGCVSNSTSRSADSQGATSESKPKNVGLYSKEPMTEFWLKKYNIAAQSGLERSAIYNQYLNNDSRFNNSINAVLRYDRRRADYFYTEVAEELAREDRDSDDYSWLQGIFRRHGVVYNSSYYDYFGGDFLWRVHDSYEVSESTRELLESLYPADLYTVPKLDVVDTDKLTANVQSGHLAFLAPDSIVEYCRSLGCAPKGIIEAVAAHEATHYINGQVLDALVGVGGQYGYYRNNLDELSEITPYIDFYHPIEVEEFIADAVAIQTSKSAENPDHVIGFFASRVVKEPNIFELVDTWDEKTSEPKVRKAPHYASAEFIYRLFEQEEERRRLAGETLSITIQQLTSQGLNNTSWKKENWLPYLNVMLTPQFMEDVRQQYRSAFENIRSELRMEAQNAQQK